MTDLRAGHAVAKESTGHSTRDNFDASPVGAAPRGNAERLQWAMHTAREMGLRITSTTGDRHAPHSYHYQGRAVDVAGSAAQMARFYDAMRPTNPTELFYDPRGGVKHGRDIDAIGGHRDHVHVAF